MSQNLKPKFTPGPWKSNPYQHSMVHGFAVYSDKMCLDKVADDIKSQANATLISAAPELYQKLIEFIDVLENCEINAHKTDVDLNETLIEARKILNKAGGN